MKELVYGRKLMKWVLIASIIIYTALFALFLLRTAVTWMGLAMAIGITGIQVIRLFMLHFEKDNLIGYLLPVIEYILILGLFYGTETNMEGMAFAVYTIDIILFYKPWVDLVFAYAGFTCYIIVWGIYREDIINVCISSFNYCVFIAVIWGIKILLKQRDTILRLNRKILEQSSAMEGLAKLKERNRIAEEVHNTVGHKLTTAIVSLEGAHLLFEKKPNEAYKRLSIAREQLKEGLGDIREVVRTIKSQGGTGTEGSLKASMEQMAKDVEIQTGIHINRKFCLQEKLLSLQEYVLLNAAKEGITNAIKHAAPGNIEISLLQTNGQVRLDIENDGRGCDAVIEGFGLKAMRENVEAIGGRVFYECRPGGFKLSLFIPVVEGV